MNKHWTVRDIVIRSVSGVYVLAVRFKSIKQDRRIERPEARGDHRLDAPQGEASKGGSDWSFVGDLPGHPLSPFKWYKLLMGFYPGPRAETSPFFLSMDKVRPYTYAAAMTDFKKLLRRVSPDDIDYGLHGLRVEGWNLGAAVDPDLAEAHGGWKPGNASRYSRFNLTSVFNLSKGMVAFHDVPPPAGAGDGVTAETAIDAEAHDPPRDLAVDAIFNIDELGDMRWETGADGASDEDVAAFSPGRDVARPHGHLRALRPAGGAGGSNDPLPLAQGQPEALAVVPQVTEPHAYVGAALRFVANSPPSRALTRLRASLLQQP